jgi:DNA-binding IclR family transcriptional regulator
MGARDRLTWQRAVCASGLPAVARLAALAVSLYSNDAGTQGMWLTSSDIANLTGLKALTTVNTHLQRLMRDGWLYKADGAWWLGWPGELPMATAAAAAAERAG